MEEDARQQGRRSGRLDRLIGIRSDYAWRAYELDMVNAYSHAYGLGYREGWLGRKGKGNAN